MSENDTAPNNPALTDEGRKHDGFEAELTLINSDLRQIIQVELATSPYALLSKVGSELGTEKVTRLKLLSGQRSLGRYIADKYKGEWEVKPIENFGLGITQKAGQRLGERVSPALNQKPAVFRYDRRFWAAFSVPLDSGKRIMDQSDFIFSDIANDDLCPENALIITPDFVAPPDAPNRIDLITSNIERWLEKRNLVREDFAAKRAESKVIMSPELVHRSVLHAVIDSLDKRQLQSQSLSLDVVAALLRQLI
jgi:hypothetical protein